MRRKHSRGAFFMRIVTAEEMASIDAFSMKEAGIPGIVLMESAGRAAA